jgi:23S rRNA pseudouridine2605 synthase
MDEGEHLQALKARILSANNTQSEVELELAEGKNREIRRLCLALGLHVTRLKRVKIGPIPLGELPVGKWRTLTESEIKSLLPPL